MRKDSQNRRLTDRLNICLQFGLTLSYIIRPISYLSFYVQTKDVTLLVLCCLVVLLLCWYILECHFCCCCCCQVIRTVAVIILLFMACMLPNQIAWILFDFGGENARALSHAFWNFAEALMYLHACVNPAVYGTLTRQFRRGYLHYFRLLLCCSCARGRGFEPTRMDRSKIPRVSNHSDAIHLRDSVVCTNYVATGSLAGNAQITRLFFDSSARQGGVWGAVDGAKNETKIPSPAQSNGMTQQEPMAFSNLSFEAAAVKSADGSREQDTRL